MAIQLYRSTDVMAEKSSFEIMPLAFQLADKLAATEFVPVALRNRPAAVAAAILTGHEIGLPPMASLAHIHVINGRPTLSAAGMRGLILAHGHRIWVEESTVTRATVCSQRRGEERVATSSWTMDDAERAKLKHKDNWIAYPRAMLVARATGDNARGSFMDVLAGIAYTTEEAEDMDIDLSTSASSMPAVAPGTVRRRARRAATAAAVLSEPPPAPEPVAGDEGTPATAAEPPPGPEPEATAAPKAGAASAVDVGAMTLAQQIAMVCREANIDRAALIAAVTGKKQARDLTRAEAAEVLDKARAIARGEMSLTEADGRWVLVVSAAAVEGGDATSKEQTSETPPSPALPEDPGAAFRR